MKDLEQLLREEAAKPNQSAVKYTKANEMTLCREHNVGRGALRQVAVMIDKQNAAGFKAEETAKRAERKFKLAKAPVKEEKAKEKPKSKKKTVEKPKPKPKKKVVVKKKSKPKG